jgi:hypothetical protein
MFHERVYEPNLSSGHAKFGPRRVLYEARKAQLDNMKTYRSDGITRGVHATAAPLTCSNCSNNQEIASTKRMVGLIKLIPMISAN